MKWDDALGLYRAKCSGVTKHPVTDAVRKSPHEAFTNLGICLTYFVSSIFKDFLIGISLF